MTENEALKIATHCLGVQAEQEVCEECPVYRESGIVCKEIARTAITALKEVQQYRAIGTVEECREARKKAKTRKTRKSKFLEMFPDAPITDGIPCVSPCDLSTEVTDKGGLCDEYSENSDCKECRRKYWLEEVE